MHMKYTLGLCVLGLAALTGPMSAQAQTVHASLSGYQEVPAVSSLASGSFSAKIDEAAGTIHWQLSYSDLQADALQSHIHFGQHSVNGGISAFFCSNLGNGPAGTVVLAFTPAL